MKVKQVLIVILALVLTLFIGYIFRSSQIQGSFKSVIEPNQTEHHSPPSVVIEPGSAVETASYIIFTDDEDIFYAKNGTTGKIDFSGTDASTVIQSAIDAANAAGGGLVYCHKATYNPSTTIILKSFVRLEFELGSIITPTADIDIIQMKPLARLVGAGFLTSGMSSFTKSCILLDAGDKLTGWETIIENVMGLGHYDDGTTDRGTFLKLVGGTVTNGYIAWVTARNIEISGFRYGILFDNNPPSLATPPWMNANHFYDVRGYATRYFIYLRRGQYGGEVAGNRFYGVKDQPASGPYSYQGITLDGYDNNHKVENNYFDGMLWDNHEYDNKAILLNTYTKHNSLHILCSRDKVQDNGDANYFEIRRNHGVKTLSGDGSTTMFFWAHGLYSKPFYYTATKASNLAQNIKYVDANDWAIIVYFDSPPPSGTNNINITWEVSQ